MVGRRVSRPCRAGVLATGVDPCVEVVAAVEDAAAEAEAAGAGNGVGHGCLLNGSGVVGRYAYRRRGFGPFGDTPPPTSAQISGIAAARPGLRAARPARP